MNDLIPVKKEEKVEEYHAGELLHLHRLRGRAGAGLSDITPETPAPRLLHHSLPD